MHKTINKHSKTHQNTVETRRDAFLQDVDAFRQTVSQSVNVVFLAPGLRLFIFLCVCLCVCSNLVLVQQRRRFLNIETETLSKTQKSQSASLRARSQKSQHFKVVCFELLVQLGLDSFQCLCVAWSAKPNSKITVKPASVYHLNLHSSRSFPVSAWFTSSDFDSQMQRK